MAGGTLSHTLLYQTAKVVAALTVPDVIFMGANFASGGSGMEINIDAVALTRS
jgi:hypothetical protein